MRTVKLHTVVGYELPQHRAACRHCTELDGAYDDRPGFSSSGRWTCKEHKFDVQLGGVCSDFDWKGAAYKRTHQPGEPGGGDDRTLDLFVSTR